MENILETYSLRRVTLEFHRGVENIIFSGLK